MNIKQELNSIKELVEYTLEYYPETRNSDNELYFKCCEVLGVNNIDKVKKLNLSIISIHKIRQHIQNKEKRFLPTEDIRKHRKRRSIHFRSYFKECL